MQEVASASALAIAEVVGACQASDANSAGCARGDAEVEVIANVRPAQGRLSSRLLCYMHLTALMNRNGILLHAVCLLTPVPHACRHRYHR